MDNQLTEPGLALFRQVKISKPFNQADKSQWIDLLSLLKEVNASCDLHGILNQTMQLFRFLLSEGGVVRDSSEVLFCEPSFAENNQFHAYFELGSDISSNALEICELAHLFNMAIGTGESFLIQQSERDPIFLSPTALQKCAELLCLPIRLESSRVCWMILGHSQPSYFSYDKLEFINLVWSIVLPAIQEKTENQSLWNENRRLHAFQEEFRGKLAKELHDGPAQSLSSLAMRLDIARRMIERDGAQSIDELSKAENLIKQTAQDLRYLLILTRPLKIEPDGLPAFLECYAEKVSALFDLDVTIKTEGNFDDLPEIWLQNELFHLVEELVSNARKCTLTKHIWVRIIKKSDSITFDVDDDGEPFDMDRFSTSNQPSNISLIDAHVNRLVGTANASQSIKGGTNIHIVLPVKSQN